MESWNVQHRVFVFKTYFQNRSYIKTIRAFRKHFQLNPKDPVPSRNTVKAWMENFDKTGSVNKTKPPGHARTVRTPENIERVRTALVNSPSRSGKKHAAALRLSRRSFHRIVKNDLSFHPYKILITQQLKPADYGARLMFANKMIEMLDSGALPLDCLMMSDEAHFHLDGNVNKQNCRYYAESNPLQIVEKPLHSLRVTVWCAVGEWGIIGPFFFDGTVNTQRYTDMLATFFLYRN